MASALIATNQQWTVTHMNNAAIRQSNAKLADGGPAMALVDRLSKLDAPDREVDAEIAVLFSGDPDAYVVRPNEGAMFSHKPGWFATGDNKSHKSPEYTTSVDAAIALAERVLPGWTWYLGFGLRLEGDMRAIAGFYPNNRPDSCVKDDHPIPAIALCIALLRAKGASNA